MAGRACRAGLPDHDHDVARVGGAIRDSAGAVCGLEERQQQREEETQAQFQRHPFGSADHENAVEGDCRLRYGELLPGTKLFYSSTTPRNAVKPAEEVDFQIEPQTAVRPSQTAVVQQRHDGSLVLLFQRQPLPYRETEGARRATESPIGIGGTVTRPPLPHHRTCGSASGGSVVTWT